MAFSVQRLLIEIHIRVADETGADWCLGLLNELSECLRAQVDALNQIVASIEDGVIEAGLDNWPHLVSRVEVISCRSTPNDGAPR